MDVLFPSAFPTQPAEDPQEDLQEDPQEDHQEDLQEDPQDVEDPKPEEAITTINQMLTANHQRLTSMYPTSHLPLTKTNLENTSKTLKLAN